MSSIVLLKDKHYSSDDEFEAEENYYTIYRKPSPRQGYKLNGHLMPHYLEYLGQSKFPCTSKLAHDGDLIYVSYDKRTQELIVGIDNDDGTISYKFMPYTWDTSAYEIGHIQIIEPDLIVVVIHNVINWSSITSEILLVDVSSHKANVLNKYKSSSYVLNICLGEDDDLVAVTIKKTDLVFVGGEEKGSYDFFRIDNNVISKSSSLSFDFVQNGNMESTYFFSDGYHFFIYPEKVNDWRFIDRTFYNISIKMQYPDHRLGKIYIILSGINSKNIDNIAYIHKSGFVVITFGGFNNLILKLPEVDINELWKDKNIRIDFVWNADDKVNSVNGNLHFFEPNKLVFLKSDGINAVYPADEWLEKEWAENRPFKNYPNHDFYNLPFYKIQNSSSDNEDWCEGSTDSYCPACMQDPCMCSDPW